jgi:hypothetical protein
VISAFDVVHDAVDPPALVGAIHRGLDPDGTFLMLEMNSADDPDENVGPLATLLYGVLSGLVNFSLLSSSGVGILVQRVIGQHKRFGVFVLWAIPGLPQSTGAWIDRARAQGPRDAQAT